MEIIGSTLVIREVDRDDHVSRFFLRVDNSDVLIHPAGLKKKVKMDVIIDHGHVEYLVDLTSIPRPTILYKFTVRNGEPYLDAFLIHNDTIKPISGNWWGVKLTSGYSRVDRAVEELVAYRSCWCKKLCGFCEKPLVFYEAFLKAKIGLNYGLFTRIKEAWQEYSSEYLSYIYLLVHEILVTRGYRPVEESLESIKHVCQDVYSAKTIDLSNASIQYTSPSSDLLLVHIDKMLGDTRPDLLLSTPRSQVIIECKQGPIKTWVKKAIKQATRYKRYANTLILVTSRSIPQSYYEALAPYYDYIVENCTHRDSTLCRIYLEKILENSLLF